MVSRLLEIWVRQGKTKPEMVRQALSIDRPDLIGEIDFLFSNKVNLKPVENSQLAKSGGYLYKNLPVKVTFRLGSDIILKLHKYARFKKFKNASALIRHLLLKEMEGFEG